MPYFSKDSLIKDYVSYGRFDNPRPLFVETKRAEPFWFL